MTEPIPQPEQVEPFDRETAMLQLHANDAARHAVESMQLRVRVAELEHELKKGQPS